MPSINNIRITIGGPEETAGTAVDREFVVPIRSVPTIDNQVERGEDPAIVGRNMTSGEYALAENSSGNLPLAFRPCGAVGQLLKSLLGTEATPTKVAALIKLKYTGTAASCKIVANTTADTLAASTGALGAETADVTFGTAGVITLTELGFDTVGELVTAIDAYANYECEKVFGADSVSTGDIIAITSAQAAGRWVYLWFSTAVPAAVTYLHKFTVDLSNTERPTYSIQKDGFQDQFLYAGCVVDSFSISAALKAMVEAECEILAFSETEGQTASELSLEDVDPLIFHSGVTTFGANDYTYIRNLSLAIANNHNADGYGQGSIGRKYHEKGKFDVTGDLQVRLDATSYAERAKKFDGDIAGLSLLFTGKEIETGIPELVLIELPYCVMSNFEYVENNGTFDAKMSYRAVSPKGTVYGSPCTISILTKDTEAY